MHPRAVSSWQPCGHVERLRGPNLAQQFAGKVRDAFGDPVGRFDLPSPQARHRPLHLTQPPDAGEFFIGNRCPAALLAPGTAILRWKSRKDPPLLRRFPQRPFISPSEG